MNEIKNKPNYAKEYSFIVAREIDNDLWYWGAYNDRNEANRVASEINGMVFQNEK